MIQINHLLVDAHVHFHECFDPLIFFSHALNNFEKGREELRIGSRTLGCLCFTEGAGDNYYQKLQNQRNQSSRTGWTFHRTSEEVSVLCKMNGKVTLIVIAGRQIVTKEGLEVLALGMNSSVADGLPLQMVIDKVRQDEAISIIPWGFGKWWGRRGNIVRNLLMMSEPNGIYLGDNGGRLNRSPDPSHFKIANSKGIKILPGTDPLPFKGQNRNAGGYGFLVRGAINLEYPWRSLKNVIEEAKFQPTFYGKRSNFFSFCYYQVAMQLKKRIG